MYKFFSGVMIGICVMFMLLGEHVLSGVFLGLAIMFISLDMGLTSTKKELVS